MNYMKILNNLQIMKNSNESCIAGKIFVHFSNVVLWATMAYVAFAVTFIPETPEKRMIGFLCLMGFIVDFVFMASIEAPVFHNPFNKGRKKSDKNNGGSNYLSDIEAATKEAELPGTTLGNLF